MKIVYKTSRVEVGELTADDWMLAPGYLRFIVGNMRPSDRHEFACAGLTADLEASALNMAFACSPSYIAFLDGVPVFFFGASRMFDHTRAGIGFGTSDALRTMPAITDALKRQMFPRLKASGVKRIEVRIPAQNKQTLRWLTDKLGGEVEACIKGAATTGEAMFQVALIL